MLTVFVECNRPHMDSSPKLQALRSIAETTLLPSSHPPVLFHLSSRPPSGKLLQIRSRRNTQHKPPPLIRNDRKLLLPIFSILAPIEEQLQFL